MLHENKEINNFLDDYKNVYYMHNSNNTKEVK